MSRLMTKEPAGASCQQAAREYLCDWVVTWLYDSWKDQAPPAQKTLWIPAMTQDIRHRDTMLEDVLQPEASS